MLGIKSLVEDLGVFEGNKILLDRLELKVLGLAFYIQFSSLRRLLKRYPSFIGFNTAVWKWVKKFSEKINVKPSKMLSLISRHDRSKGFRKLPVLC